MKVNKITVGFVIQKFDVGNKKLISQEFVAGDQVDYENEDGEPIDVDHKELFYAPFLSWSRDW